MFTLVVSLLLSPNQLGAQAFARGQFVLAEKLFLAAWQLAPCANVASNLGAVHRKRGNLPAAEQWFNTVYRLREETLGPAHPDTVIALNNRAVARQQLGQLHAARADFVSALARVYPGTADHAAILTNFGDLALAQARLREAQSLCAQALQVNPSSPCRHKLQRVALQAGAAP